MRRLIFLSCTFIFILFLGLSVKVNAIEYDVDTTNQDEALLITYVKSDISAHNYLITFGLDYKMEFSNHDVKIYYLGSLIETIDYSLNFLTIYIEYTTGYYYIVICETLYFSRLENTTEELFRTSYAVTDENITLYADSNFQSVIGLQDNYLDTIEYINSQLVINYYNTFYDYREYYYNLGYDQGYLNGSAINPDDYIEKENALGWLFALFDAFTDFFAIRLGPVSIGAIVIVPLAISLVWFILRMLRGGGAG